ncbi:mannitol dehydrogenase family protein [Testudinibacter sp. P27/CKL/0425]
MAYLAGMDYVGQAMDDEQLRDFVEQAIYQEIIPVLSLPQDELKTFAQAVINRFRNPFIQHQLLSISLNSMTKYVTRILPQLLAYVEKYKSRLTFALAALIVFYRGQRNGEATPLNDDQHWLQHFELWWRQVEQQQISIAQLVSNVLQQREHWQQDLNEIPGLGLQVSEQINSILANGIRTALRVYCKD